MKRSSSSIVVQIEQRIRKPVQREPHFVKTSGQAFVNIAEIAAARGGVGSDELIIRPADLLVKRQVRRAAKTAALRVLVENAAEEKRVIANMRPEQERLLGRRPGQRDQHIGNILALRFPRHVRRAQPARARKRFEERRDVIAELAIGDADVAQDMARQDIKIKVRRNLEVSRVRKDRVDQPRIIQNGIARFRVAEKIDQRDVIRLRPGQNADDKVEICRREARPTIRLDHRDRSISIARAGDKPRQLLTPAGASQEAT